MVGLEGFDNSMAAAKTSSLLLPTVPSEVQVNTPLYSVYLLLKLTNVLTTYFSLPCRPFDGRVVIPTQSTSVASLGRVFSNVFAIPED